MLIFKLKLRNVRTSQIPNPELSDEQLVFPINPFLVESRQIIVFCFLHLGVTFLLLLQFIVQCVLNVV